MPDVLMPRLSDTMTEGVLSRWVKQPGDTVHRGDVLAEIETDKATMELEAYDEGVLERTLVAAGTTVPIGAPIATIGDGSTVDTSAPQATRTPTTATTEPGSTPASDAAPTHLASGSVRTSPLARAIAREHGMDIASVLGTGPGGRIVRADVEAAVALMDDVPAPAPVREPSPSSPGAGPSPLTPPPRLSPTTSGSHSQRSAG